jgi:hypothetical protein
MANEAVSLTRYDMLEGIGCGKAPRHGVHGHGKSGSAVVRVVVVVYAELRLRGAQRYLGTPGPLRLWQSAQSHCCFRQ